MQAYVIRRVLQAIQFAIDRDELSKQVYDSLWPTANGDIFPTSQWFNPAVKDLVKYDPVAAGKLLDDAGWKPGKDGLRTKGGRPLRLTITTTAGRQQRELS